MSILKEVKLQTKNAKILFWTGQIIGIVFSLFYLVFAGGIAIGGLIQGIKTFKEDYQELMFLLFIVGIAVCLVVAWFKSKTGAYLMIIIIASGSISAIIETNRFLPALVYSPFIISGILLLWFAHIKRKIREPEGIL